MNFKKWMESFNIGDEDLDFHAFGFRNGDVITLSPDQIQLQPHLNDIENVEYAIKHSRLTPVQWARTVSLREPIDVILKDGQFWVEDGHHRWMAAKLLRKKLKCRVDIKDNPVLALRKKGINVSDDPQAGPPRTAPE